MLAGAIAYLIFEIISHNYKKEKNAKLANTIIMVLVIINIYVVSGSLYYPQGKGYVDEFIESGTVEEKCSSVNGKIQNFKKAIEYIKENDKSFYRITKKNTTYENLSIIYDYNPTQLFLSLGNKNVYNLSRDLEDNCYTSTRCINGADRRTKFTTLISNKYFICSKDDFEYVPYGYTLHNEIEDTLIYINKNYLPIGIVYDSYITKEQYNKLSPLEKADSLITAAMVEENINITDNKTIKIDEPIILNYKEKDNRVINNTIDIRQKNESIELLISEIPDDYELYLSIKNLKYISDNDSTDFKITAKINRVSNSEEVKDFISSAYYMKNPDFLMNLGITTKNQDNNLKLKFNKKGTYTFDSLQILAVSMEKYEKKIDKLKVNSIQNVKYGKNYISGNVNIESNGILQIATSYSDGWRVYVDGKEQELLKVNEAFIGTVLEAGSYNVEFKYETPYLKLGTIFSGIGVVFYIRILVIDRKRKSNI